MGTVESSDRNRKTATKTPRQQTSSTFPLTISVLNRIFDFAATDARDAILRLGLVNQQWKDTLLYAPAMWYRICEEKWPQNDKSKTASGTSVNRWSMQSFKMRTISNLRPHHGATDFADIENCVAPDFQFICPLVAQNLRVLHDEVDAKNGMNIMFCDVCEKKVFPVTTQEELREAGSEQRCVIMPASLHTAVQKANAPKLSTEAYPETVQVVNVAIAVSATNHFFDRSDLAKRDLGVKVLHHICNAFEDVADPAIPLPISLLTHNTSGPMYRFLARNALTIYMPRSELNFVFNFRVIYVQPPPTTPQIKKAILEARDNEDKLQRVAKLQNVLFADVKQEQHPAWSGRRKIISNADDDDGGGGGGSGLAPSPDLSRFELANPLSVMPENGGFQYLFCADAESSLWFQHPTLLDLCKGSPMHALFSAAGLNDPSIFSDEQRCFLIDRESEKEFAMATFAQYLIGFWKRHAVRQPFGLRTTMLQGSIARW